MLNKGECSGEMARGLPARERRDQETGMYLMFHVKQGRESTCVQLREPTVRDPCTIQDEWIESRWTLPTDGAQRGAGEGATGLIGGRLVDSGARPR